MSAVLCALVLYRGSVKGKNLLSARGNIDAAIVLVPSWTFDELARQG